MRLRGRQMITTITRLNDELSALMDLIAHVTREI